MSRAIDEARRASTWLARISAQITLYRRRTIALAALLSLLLFISTLQTEINGSTHPYTTDVGEIQNALPRWGTIHFTGYPLYTALGSLIVTGLRVVGIPPAAGASLYSALWGAAAIALLTVLMLEVEVRPSVALITSLLFALSTSMWVDASLAELHTMTMALTFAGLLFALRFYRRGEKGDLYWLAFVAGQGVAHQRAFVFSLPALALLALPRWREMLRHWLPAFGLALLGPLTYLYLPLVDWLGSDWVFSNPGTWDGFWALVLDTKTDRIIELPSSAAQLWARLRGVAAALNGDWPWPLWLGGLSGLSLLGRAHSPLKRAALALSWIPFFLLSLVIWVGFIGDALLAAKMPVIALAAVGLGMIGEALWLRRARAGRLAVVAGVLVAGVLFLRNRPQVVAITRDPAARETIALAERVAPPGDGRPATLMALWGNDFWQLAYAHRFEDRFSHLNLVDHNADFAAILARGDHLYTLRRTFYERPPEWWRERLGPVSLSSVAPRVVEIRPRERAAAPAVGDEALLHLKNGLTILRADLAWEDERTLLLSVVWQAREAVDVDYSVAVHLVSRDPPAGPGDIPAQADAEHPVDGLYPTSLWRPGEVVRDDVLLSAPPGAEPVALRVGMYRILADGQFENSDWLSLPIPERR